jgi:DNA-binding phage protein
MLGSSFNAFLLDQLRDKELALEFLKQAFEEDDLDYLIVALCNVTKAMSQLRSELKQNDSEPL